MYKYLTIVLFITYSPLLVAKYICMYIFKFVKIQTTKILSFIHIWYTHKFVYIYLGIDILSYSEDFSAGETSTLFKIVWNVITLSRGLVSCCFCLQEWW